MCGVRVCCVVYESVLWRVLCESVVCCVRCKSVVCAVLRVLRVVCMHVRCVESVVCSERKVCVSVTCV